MNSRHSTRSGSVLILTLWTLFFLAALALAVGAHVSAGIEMARRLKGDSQAYVAAREGVTASIALLMSETNEWDAEVEAWHGDKSGFENVPAGDALYDVAYEVWDEDGGSVIHYGLADEERLVSINGAGQQQLQALFEVVGELNADQTEVLARAILDWRDSDDDRLTGGKESTYYPDHGDGVEMHNDHFDAVEELLLVKGLNEGLFDKVRPYITIHGSGKVNINTAGTVVLTCLAHRWGGEKQTAASLVKKIVSYRDAGNVFESAGRSDIAKDLGAIERLDASETTLLKNIANSVQVGSRYYRGVVTGRYGVGGAGRARIEFVFDREQVRKVYWHED
jgi:general secretion pathway protein K